MRRILLVLTAALGLVIPAAPALASPDTSARGGFDAIVDFSTLSLRDGPGGTCVLTVRSRLVFTGTLRGTAAGRTTALEFGPCDQVAVTPPGTYVDVFRFRGAFTGTVNGAPVTGPLSYAGVTEVGGHIDALITLRGGPIRVIAKADAVVAQGGSYAGSVLPAGSPHGSTTAR